jgi:hypothetical protein
MPYCLPARWLTTPVAEKGEEGGRFRLPRQVSIERRKRTVSSSFFVQATSIRAPLYSIMIDQHRGVGAAVSASPWPGWCSWHLTGKVTGTGMSGRSNAGSAREEVRELARRLTNAQEPRTAIGVTSGSLQRRKFLNPGRADVLTPNDSRY